jgi:hypothetical protein
VDTRHLGEIAQLEVQKRVAEKGWFCSKPTMDGCRYDLIIDDGKKLHRVQIKYSNSEPLESSNSFRIGLRKRSGGGNGHLQRLYLESEIDAFIVYLPRSGKLYWLSQEVWLGKGEVCLRLLPPSNKQIKNITLASQYEW